MAFWQLACYTTAKLTGLALPNEYNKRMNRGLSFLRLKEEEMDRFGSGSCCQGGILMVRKFKHGNPRWDSQRSDFLETQYRVLEKRVALMVVVVTSSLN
jgi:hypothetical protein